jgi:hypothetical protein
LNLNLIFNYKNLLFLFSRELTGSETARFASSYGLAPFPDYGANMAPYATNRGLGQHNGLGMSNMQGFNGRGVGGLNGNFQNAPFLNKGKLFLLSQSELS